MHLLKHVLCLISIVLADVCHQEIAHGASHEGLCREGDGYGKTFICPLQCQSGDTAQTVCNTTAPDCDAGGYCYNTVAPYESLGLGLITPADPWFNYTGGTGFHLIANDWTELFTNAYPVRCPVICNAEITVPDPNGLCSTISECSLLIGYNGEIYVSSSMIQTTGFKLKCATNTLIEDGVTLTPVTYSS